MSPEAQRIAIARHVGATCRYCGGTGFLPLWSKEQYDHLREHFPAAPKKQVATPCAQICELPKYPADLNAMHEAEKTLDASRCAQFARLLMKHHPTYCVDVLDSRDELEDVAYETFVLIHASADQRAEAFLRTLGKWEDGA